MSTTTDLIQSTVSILLFITATITAQQCPRYKACGPPLDVRFPFGIIHQSQPEPDDHNYHNSTYPGFALTCESNNNNTLTYLPTLHLPNAGNFTVETINYLYQQLYISDPNKIFSSLNLSSSSPFLTVSELQSFVLFTCPPDDVRSGFRTVRCLSNDSSTVVALREADEKQNVPESCVEMERVRVPGWWVGDIDGFSSGGVWLQWDWPDCRSCEAVDGLCGFSGATGQEVGCSSVPTNNGLSYTLGFGILGIVCVIALLLCCIHCKKDFDTRHQHWHHNQSAMEFSSVVDPQAHAGNGGRGLNQPTIEYSDRQSKRLPKPNEDGTCAICLCEYHVKEALRTLPECNHCFHSTCIDAWLKLNSTCPVCRADTPDRSSSSSQQSRRLL